MAFIPTHAPRQIPTIALIDGLVGLLLLATLISATVFIGLGLAGS